MVVKLIRRRSDAGDIRHKRSLPNFRISADAFHQLLLPELGEPICGLLVMNELLGHHDLRASRGRTGTMFVVS